jgi:uncharacterized protein (TIGR01627 family)
MLTRLIVKAVTRIAPARRLVVMLASRLLTPRFLNLMKAANSIVLDPHEIKAIATTVKEKAPCRFLIFGAGNDSLFWAMLNRRGTTVFLEDNRSWFEKIAREHPDLDIGIVNYATELRQWKSLLESPQALYMSLPERIVHKEWDVILVDGPAGWNDEDPGRMKSIYMASRLVAPDGHVFVHDCNRQIEQVYCDRFLGKDNLVAEISLLRHYRLRHGSAYPSMQ